MAFLLILLILGVAFVNGANDVSKGIATLVGSGVGSYRRALAWGSVWTLSGALAAALISRGFIPVFSGRGLLDTAPAGEAFPIGVAAGAIGWVLLATRTGLPVSTTHALVGGLVGAGVVAAGSDGVRWVQVARAVGVPLAVSPLAALALVFAVLPAVRLLFRHLNGYCVCVERRTIVLGPAPVGPILAAGDTLGVAAGTDCPPHVVGRVDALDALHWLSAGLTNFARALNDAPKILALGIAARATIDVGPGVMIALVALAMTAGSVVAGWKVTQTLSEKVTRMSPADGLAANLVTSALVGLASTVAAPVSTTHVSTGAIVGIGMNGREVRWELVRGMLLAWVVTLPIAAVLAGAAYAALALAV
jgi:PiT family inorganic phosphate transporter